MNGVSRKKKVVASSDLKDKSFLECLRVKISLWNLSGLIVCFLCAGLYAYIVSQIHDSRVFFTGIMEVEREISFRTENGLYYSYYKQLVHAPSFIQGLKDLMNDRLTEHPSSINVLSRMNIYQEVFLAFIYRSIPFITNIFQPIFFYVYSIFLLHSILTASLFLLSWLISGTWLSGLLTYIFYIHHWGDVTRVETYMPLRENFALPFLWVQLLCLHVYFKEDFNAKYKRLMQSAIVCSTFLFALTWQFNQFAFLLQASSLVFCQVFDLLPAHKLRHTYLSLLFSMVLVSLLQFFNAMVLSGFLLSLLLSSLLLLRLQQRFPYDLNSSSLRHIFHVVCNILFVLLATVVINITLKAILQHQADEHINRFLLAKFGFNSSIDFDVKLYLCNGGFDFLDSDFAGRLGVCMVLYVFCHVCLLVLLFVSVLTTLFRFNVHQVPQLPPELAYHCIQMVAFGAVALIAMRMKYFWTPYICVFASACVFKHQAWTWLVFKAFKGVKDLQEVDRNVKHVVWGLGVVLIAYFGKIAHSSITKDIYNLRELYDPDTVELMQWINNSTQPSSAFSGSMQLMAAIKLSTERPITNHPHYEDKSLRLKTRDLSKYYGRFSASEVHSMLQRYGSKYIVMEDSICFAGYRDGCGMPYIMDTELGLKLDKKGQPLGNHPSLPPRFCDEVRTTRGDYGKLFKLVMSNKTFKVYQVL